MTAYAATAPGGGAAAPARQWSRGLVIGITALVVLTPLLLILYQSLLNAPFFDPAAKAGVGAYRFIFDDPDFWSAAKNSCFIAAARFW